jgi:hypothetical protein
LTLRAGGESGRRFTSVFPWRNVRARPYSVFSRRCGEITSWIAPRQAAKESMIQYRHEQQHPGAAEEPPPCKPDQRERGRTEITRHQRRDGKSLPQRLADALARLKKIAEGRIG